MIAYQTAVMAYKVVTSKKPEYLADKLKILNVGGSLRKKTGSISLPRYSLSISREGFLYRASTILNLMEEEWSCDPNSEKFKIHAKDWVKANIAIKPFKDSRSMSFSSRKIQNQHQLLPDTPVENRNSIRRYFHPGARPSSIHKPCIQSSIKDFRESSSDQQATSKRSPSSSRPPNTSPLRSPEDFASVSTCARSNQ